MCYQRGHALLPSARGALSQRRIHEDNECLSPASDSITSPSYTLMSLSGYCQYCELTRQKYSVRKSPVRKYPPFEASRLSLRRHASPARPVHGPWPLCNLSCITVADQKFPPVTPRTPCPPSSDDSFRHGRPLHCACSNFGKPWGAEETTIRRAENIYVPSTWTIKHIFLWDRRIAPLRLGTSVPCLCWVHCTSILGAASALSISLAFRAASA